MVSLHIRAVTVGDPLAAGFFMKALSQQYDVWAETRYARKVRVSFARGSTSMVDCYTGKLLKHVCVSQGSKLLTCLHA